MKIIIQVLIMNLIKLISLIMMNLLIILQKYMEVKMIQKHQKIKLKIFISKSLISY
jgi:hypothetical protein